MMDVQDLKFLFESFEVKAQSKSTENPHDAELRRWKEKWLFLSALVTFFLVLLTGIGFIITQVTSPSVGTVFNGIFGLAMILAGYIGGKKI